jgi:hypothetical protein
LLLLAGTVSAQSADHETRIKRLETLVLQLQDAMQDKDREISALRRQLAGADEEHVDHEDYEGHDHDDHDAHTDHDEHDSHGSRLDIAAILNVAAGTSDSRDSEIADALQRGGHDPNQRGFTFQQLDLSVEGHVDDYFSAIAHIIFGEDQIELEEAYVTTDALPAELELKAGYFFTDFGLINPAHLHAWDWIDQPVISGRLFGNDGTRGLGVQLARALPLPWDSELSFAMQQSAGDFSPSFRGEPGGHDHGEEEHEEEEGLPEEYGEEGIGGRPFYDSDTRTLEDMMYSARLHNSFSLGDSLSAHIGLSGMWGRNGNGDDSNTWIYGADLVIRPSGHDPRWTWQTEIMKREYEADAFAFFDAGADTLVGTADDIDIDLPSDTLEDWGLYTQFLYTIDEHWSVGLRYEWASGTGDSAEEGALYDRDLDAGRGDRTRVSPMIVYQPSESSRLRLQYNYDDADFIIDGEAHSIWLGLEVMLGKHAEH